LDGGGKLLTAVLLVACGALGALVFSRDDAAPAAPTAQTYGHADTLVRRTTGPITLDLGQESDIVVPDLAPQIAASPQQASISGRPAAPVDARPQGRLAAEFPPTSGLVPLQTVDAYRAASEFAAPSSSLTESPDGRRPLSNLLSAPQLPERFPGPEFETDPPVAPRPAPSTAQPENSRPLLGPPITTGAPSAAALSSPGRMTPISSTVRSGQAQEAAPQTAVAAEASPPAVAAPRRFVPLKRHTVRDGDTLADLSRRYYGDDSFAAALFEANRGVLSSPDLLPIGAVLTIPARELAVAGPTFGAAALSSTPAAVLVPKPEFNAFGAPPINAAPSQP
jgi:phage tail protein X